MHGADPVRPSLAPLRTVIDNGRRAARMFPASSCLRRAAGNKGRGVPGAPTQFREIFPGLAQALQIREYEQPNAAA